MQKSKLALLIYWIVAAAVIAALTQWAACRASAAISDCIDATCRISTADGSRGTGCVFEIGRDRVYVLTAAHVVGARPTARCEFWREGHQSEPLTARVVVSSRAADVAVVAVPTSAFAGLLPGTVPLAPPDYVVRPGDTLMSVGCAGGSWSTAWKGHALEYRGRDLHFVPTPADGRSGSAIFDAAGERIVGLLRARTAEADGSHGIATSLPALHKALADRQARMAGDAAPTRPPRMPASSQQMQCPGGACPTPWRLSPYRYGQDQRDQYQNERMDRLERNPVYPTLPPSLSAPAPPPVDLEVTNGKIDKLTGRVDLLIEELRGRRAAPPQPVAPPLPISSGQGPGQTAGEAALEAAEEAKAAATAAHAEVEQSRQQNGKLREMLGALIGEPETLQERVATRIAKVKGALGDDAGTGEVARAYVKDLAAEKLSGTAGWTVGRLLAGTLGLSGPLSLALGGAALLISRRIGHKLQSGDPLLVERLVGRLGEKIDDLKDRLHDGQSAAAPPRKAGR